MTRSALLQRFRADLARAEADLLRDGTLAPLVAVVGRDEVNHVLPLDMRDDTARARSVNTARLVAVAADADLVVFRAEVWVVAGAELAEGVTPATSERRVEAVAVAVMGRVAGKIERRVGLREILRDPDGRPTGFRALATSETGRLGGAPIGWMTDLLAPRRPTAEAQRLAGALLRVMTEKP